MDKPLRRQLVVSVILKEVWRTLREYRGHLVRLMIIVGTVPAIFVGIGFTLQPGPTPNVAGFVLFVLLSVLAYAVVYIVCVVACHRCVLLGERKLEFAEWGARVIRYAFRAFLVAMLSMIPTVALFVFVGPLLSRDNPMIGPLSTLVVVTIFFATLVMYVPTAYVAGRLSLVLPAVAVDRELTLTESVWLTKRNGWRLAVLIGLIPVGIPLALEGAIAIVIAKGAYAAPLAWIWGLFGCYFQVAYMMATAVILSTCFRHLAEERR